MLAKSCFSLLAFTLGSWLAVSGQAKGPSLQLAWRYPGGNDKDWEAVTNDFSKEFRFYRDWLQRNIEDTFSFSGNQDPAVHFDYLIKRCEEKIAQRAFSGPAIGPKRREAPEKSYREAYEAWMKGTFEIDISYWLHNDRGSPTFRPLMDLLEIGPNITPFLVNELRREASKDRLYRLCTLIGYLTGIDVRRGREFTPGEILARDYPASREQFLADWDAGIVTDPTESLRMVRRTVDEDKVLDKVDFPNLQEVRTHGIYALPFIVETLKEHNSDELFAAFLAVTAQYGLYSRYCNSPRHMFVTQPEKLAYVRAWFKNNEHRINELTQVYAKVKELLGE